MTREQVHEWIASIEADMKATNALRKSLALEAKALETRANKLNSMKQAAEKVLVHWVD